MKSNKWKNVQLGEIVNFRRGHDLPKTKMLSGEYPVIGSNGIIGSHNEFKNKGPNVTIGRSGTVGIPFFYDGDAWPHNTSLYIDDFKGNNPRYIYYLLQTLKLERFGGGSAVPTLNRNHIHPIIVNYNKSLEEQTIIAAILNSFDEKITLNKIVISKIEEIIQLIFKRWFIDFEFPNKDGQPYKSNDGKMSESELGITPEQWNIEDLDSITSKFATGLNPRKNFKLGEGSNYYVTIKNLGQNRIYLNEKCDKVTDDALVKINKRSNLKSGDLLFSGIGTIGRVFLIDKDPLNWNISESLFTLRPNERVSSEYLYLLLLSNDLQNYAKQLASGSVQKGIRMGDLKKYKFPLPPKEIMEIFTELVSPQIKLIKSLERESDKLSKLRDTLLPKLLTGEIEVPVLEPEQV